MPHIGFAGEAAPGLAEPGGASADDLMDLFDPEIWRTTGSAPGFPERGAAAAALFCCAGATPLEACNITRSAWRSDGGERVFLAARRYAPRTNPMLATPKMVIARYVAASRPAAGCDRLLLDSRGRPADTAGLLAQFHYLGVRIGLDGGRLPTRLRALFTLWLDEADDEEAAAELCGWPKMDSEPVSMARKRAVLVAYHPLGKISRQAGRRPGPVDRKFPDRSFPKLSRRAQLDTDAAHKTKGAPYPEELRRAIVAAADVGHFRRAIAGHYRVTEARVDVMKRRQRQGKLALAGGGGLKLRSNQNILLRQARSNREWTAPRLAEWMRAEHGVETTADSVYHLLGTRGIRLARPRLLAPYEDEIRAMIGEQPLLQNLDLIEWLEREKGVTASEEVVARSVRLLGLGRDKRHTRPSRLAPYAEEIRARLVALPWLSYSDVVDWLAEEKGVAATHDMVAYVVRESGLRRGCPRIRHGVLAPYEAEILAMWKAKPGISYDDIVAWLAEEKNVATNKINVGYLIRRKGLGRGR